MYCRVNEWTGITLSIVTYVSYKTLQSKIAEVIEISLRTYSMNITLFSQVLCSHAYTVSVIGN